jgi:putative toxin-antitoxin system antitoxin component (TIGR02293 family)
MGGPQVLGLRVRSILDLSAAVERGLPKSALKTTVERVFGDSQNRRRMIYRIVPEATYKRRRDRLTLVESERTERLARVIATAEYVWDDPQKAHRFLAMPHPQLAGKSPLEASATELGARQVEELLARIFYGLPA